ncbi:unnamed protein product [Vitrella brassicaformis CCMP3155]|uniref:Uncharacterized protein n=1 Tax=Vitrella brassicaformis (strain CCMP3155) TaxID=1169540 RepID=A0A0G4EKU6_VITBC|nr:unnamed protein product [Vitrella brassicaformis CCMP3155]|eukprot:CEL97791.1 unnamed protein product [Vitrella brassicaformis CCMP3155]
MGEAWLSDEPLVRNWNVDPDYYRPLPHEMWQVMQARAREIWESQMRYADALAAGSFDWGDENEMVTCGAEGGAAADGSGRMEIEL